MSIQTELQSLEASALLEFFVLDTTSMPGGMISYFHAGTNQLMQPVVWQGNTYLPVPIEAEGFDLSTKGALPRPVLRVANIDGLFSAEAKRFDDLIGCKVTRKRTFAKYLDAVNFPQGNPYADPNQHLPDDLWFVDRKTSENRYVIEWELASAFDLQGVMLPFRQIVQNSCQWKYRGPECGWTGVEQGIYFDKQDKQTYVIEQDYCAKRLSSCECRFGSAVALPFGGFPGAQRSG